MKLIKALLAAAVLVLLSLSPARSTRIAARAASASKREVRSMVFVLVEFSPATRMTSSLCTRLSTRIAHTVIRAPLTPTAALARGA